MRITVFTDKNARTKVETETTFEDFCASIINSEPVAYKEDCVWIKLATFGDVVENPETGCLRTNRNMLSCSGVELDYDLEEMSIDEAVDLFSARGIKAFLYTSPSHTAERPRFRVVLPFSCERAPEERDVYAARGNGVLGGVVSDESFTRSQAYYAGRVAGVAFEWRTSNGTAHIDEVDGLPEIGRQGGNATGPSGYTIEAAYDDIIAGSNLHGAINHLAMVGEPRSNIEAAMQDSKAKTDDHVRWARRLAEIDRSIRGAERRRMRDIEKKLARMPIPPRPAEPKRQLFETFTAASLHGKEIPRQEWLVHDMIPTGQPALLSGDGGLGKSLLAMQLAVSVSSSGMWLGRFVTQGPVLYVSCEDETEEVHRRLSRISTSLDKLDNLHIAPLADLDALLVAPRDGALDLTPLFDAMAARIEAIRPVLVILDSLADVYGGNEVVRAEVRWFVAQLRKLCHHFGCSIIILSHPSLSGMASGSGLSGSTHWNNSVRARCYLTGPTGEGGDRDERMLEVMKNNRGALGTRIALKWQAGVFVAIDGGADVNPEEIDALFLELLARYTRQERYVNNSGGSNYAPSLFYAEPAVKAKRISKKQLRDSMNRLFAAERIVMKTRRSSGHDHRYIAVA